MLSLYRRGAIFEAAQWALAGIFGLRSKSAYAIE
jgi:hypothetical protein